MARLQRWVCSLLLTGSVAAWLFAGCTAIPPSPVAVPGLERPTMSSPKPSQTTAPKVSATPASTKAPAVATSTPESGQPVALQARADLAARLKVAPSQVEIISVIQTEMPVGSLGCGPESRVAAPGIVMGDEIRLQAEGQEYIYRSDGRQLVPCLPGIPPAATESQPAAGTDAAAFQAANIAKNDLSQRTGAAKSAIKVLSSEAVVWPDSSLGCPEPGMMYTQALMPGYRIILEANGQQYEYHTGRSRVVLCEHAQQKP